MAEVNKRPEQLEFEKVKRYNKELKAMNEPGVFPFQEILLVVSKLFKILVYVHFGLNKPIVYRGMGVQGDNIGVLHLQCLSGVHYNWVIERSNYVREELQEEAIEEVIPDENPMCYEVNLVCDPSEPIETIYCSHNIKGKMEVRVQREKMAYCGLIDTGSQISLVNSTVVEDLERLHLKFQRKPAHFRLNGIGSGYIFAWEEIIIEITIGALSGVVQRFIVLTLEHVRCFFVTLTHSWV